MDRAFPGRDLSRGLLLEDCEVIYKVAVAAQPLAPSVLTKSATESDLSLRHVVIQEEKLREIFVSRAGPSGSVHPEQVGAVLGDIGFTDTAIYTPRFLEDFK